MAALTSRTHATLRLAALVGDTPLLRNDYALDGSPRRVYAKYEPMNLTAVWDNGEAELSDFRWLFDVDLTDYAFLSFSPGLVELLDSQGKIVRGRTAPRTLSFAVREDDVPVGTGDFPLHLIGTHTLSRHGQGGPFMVGYGPFR